MKHWKEYLTSDNELLLTQSLLHCHASEVHSLVLDKDDSGFYTRMFITDKTHTLWRNHCGLMGNKWDELSIAIHPHHVDIELESIYGILWNLEFSHKQKRGKEKGQVTLDKYQFRSEILNGKGGFNHFGQQTLIPTKQQLLSECKKLRMTSGELHTVYVSKGQTAAWVVRESEASVPNNGICYSNADLLKWTSDGLYQKPTLDQINKILKLINIKL